MNILVLIGALLISSTSFSTSFAIRKESTIYRLPNDNIFQSFSFEIKIFSEDGYFYWGDEKLEIANSLLLTDALSFYMAEDPDLKYDCTRFMLYLNGKKELNTDDSQLPCEGFQDKFIRPLSALEQITLDQVESKIQPGTSIVFLDADGETEHFAIYLDKGLYISKWGFRGPVMVTDLENLIVFYSNIKKAVILPDSLFGNLMKSRE